MVALLHHPDDRGAHRDRDSIEKAGMPVAMVAVDAGHIKSCVLHMLMFSVVAIPSDGAHHTPAMKAAVDIAIANNRRVAYTDDLVFELISKPSSAAAVPPSQQPAGDGQLIAQ